MTEEEYGSGLRGNWTRISPHSERDRPVERLGPATPMASGARHQGLAAVMVAALNSLIKQLFGMLYLRGLRGSGPGQCGF